MVHDHRARPHPRADPRRVYLRQLYVELDLFRQRTRGGRMPRRAAHPHGRARDGHRQEPHRHRGADPPHHRRGLPPAHARRGQGQGLVRLRLHRDPRRPHGRGAGAPCGVGAHRRAPRGRPLVVPAP